VSLRADEKADSRENARGGTYGSTAATVLAEAI
jgi:hypothetical protein